MIGLFYFALAVLASPFKSKCRVGEDVSILTPGRGRRSPPPAPTERSMRIYRTTLFDRWFTVSRCYLFKFRFHGQLIFSLNRRPYLPLNGAHVAQEQFTYR